MGLSWVGIPTLLVGSHSKRGSFQLLAIGYSSRQDSVHVAAAMRAIKQWCVENQIVHEPFVLLADSAGCFSSAFKAVHGPFIPDSLDSDYRLVPPTSASTSTTGGLTQGNIRIHCHVHLRDNINKALNKYIKPSNTSETKWAEDEKKRFRSAINFLQNISSERHFGIACQLMTAAWKRHHEDLVKYFEENWLQRKCIWAQGVPDEARKGTLPNYMARSNNACEAVNRALKEGYIERGTSIAALTMQLMEVCNNYARRTEANLKIRGEDGKIEKKYVTEAGKWTRTETAANIWMNEEKTRYYLPSYTLVKSCRRGTSELQHIIEGFEGKYESDDASAWASWDEMQTLMTNITVVERRAPHYECTCSQGRTGVCKHVLGVYLLENQLSGYDWKDFQIPGGSPAGRPQ
ncbi:hypothetical protein FOZ60_008280 [Perkinsus olseni]|uniref:SWIM-type domain-containing protein n=1 Tax=Perkinsus olseni TaxID=32597 RepID=A0A7J6PG09_PEROL|nr:hypothetical protein FOZ60_008280 [Perkinsus olseni]